MYVRVCVIPHICAHMCTHMHTNICQKHFYFSCFVIPTMYFSYRELARQCWDSGASCALLNTDYVSWGHGKMSTSGCIQWQAFLSTAS